MNAKSLTVKDTFHPIGFAYMSKWTIFEFTAFSVSTEWHFGQIILMKKLAGGSFHTEISKPVATYNSPESRIVFGGSEDWFRFVACGKDGTCFAIRKGVECFRNTMFQCVIFEIVLDLIRCKRLRGRCHGQNGIRVLCGRRGSHDFVNQWPVF